MLLLITFTIFDTSPIEMFFYYHYTECNLFSLSFVDERDAIQKKTFTKWVNKHLKKVRKKNKILLYLNLYSMRLEISVEKSSFLFCF